MTRKLRPISFPIHHSKSPVVLLYISNLTTTAHAATIFVETPFAGR